MKDRTDEDRAARPFRSMYGLGGLTWPELIATFAAVPVILALWLVLA